MPVFKRSTKAQMLERATSWVSALEVRLLTVFPDQDDDDPRVGSVEAHFPGYARQQLGAASAPQWDPVNQRHTVDFPDVVFEQTADAAPQQIVGAIVSDQDGTVVFGYPWPYSITMEKAGEKLKVHVSVNLFAP